MSRFARFASAFAIVAVVALIGAPTLALDNTDVLIEERTRLESLQLKVQAARSLGEQRRMLTTKLLDDKQAGERARVKEAYDDVVRALAQQGSERREQLIGELERHILRYGRTQASGDLYLRLAELYFQRSRAVYDAEMGAYIEAQEALDRGEDVDPGRLPQPDYAKSKELFEEFLEMFPDHRYVRDALYLLGYVLEEDADIDGALTVYEQLLRRDPDGPLAPEVAFRVGLYHFRFGDLEAAADSFRHAVQLDDKVYFDKALYMLSWAYYLDSDLDRALLGFHELIDMARLGALSESTMRDESMQYMAIIFSERGGLSALQDFFAARGGRPYEDEVVARLGDLYFETGDFAQARVVYEELIRRQPRLRMGPEVGRKIEQAWLQLRETEPMLRSRLQFAEWFGPGSPWYAGWLTAEPAMVREVAIEAEKKRFDWALWLHGEAQEAESPMQRDRGFALADNAYVEFGKQFPESNRLAEAVFNRAEIAYTQGRWADAAKLYRQVTEIDINPNSQIFGEAAWNMMLSRRKALEVYELSPAGKSRIGSEEAWRKEREAAPVEITGAASVVTAEAPAAATQPVVARRARADTAATPTTAAGERKLPLEAGALIRESIYYVKLYPLGERSPNVFYTTGDIYFRFGFYERARDRYREFVDRFPENEFVLDAIQQIARTYILERKFGELVRWGYRVYESPLANRQEIYLYFTNILSGAMFKDAEQLMDAGKLSEAADVFLRMVERFPKSEFVDKALINAAVSYQKRGDWDRSSAVFRRIYREMPDNPIAPNALFQVAWNAERVLDYNEAVSRYTELLEVFPKAKEGKDALFNAATFLAKSGEARRAAELYLDYIRRYPGEEDEAENIFFAAKAYFDDGEYDTARELFARYVQHPQRTEREIEARRFMADIAERQGDDKQFLTILEEIIRISELLIAGGKPVDPKYPTEAAYILAERFDQSYRELKLKLPMATLARTLERKAELLAQVSERYTNVLNYKDPFWSSAALHKLGEAFQHFAESLFQAPVPSELDEEEAEIYRMELEDQAFPVEEKAMQAWRRNLDLADRLGIRNVWVAESREKLIRLYPELARVKAEERWTTADNEFFYRFQRSDETDPGVQIDGPRIVYTDQNYRLENLTERYRLARQWTPRQRAVVLDFPLREPTVLRDGRPIKIDGILKLWREGPVGRGPAAAAKTSGGES
jgi:TolA-binding protein